MTSVGVSLLRPTKRGVLDKCGGFCCSNDFFEPESEILNADSETELEITPLSLLEAFKPHLFMIKDLKILDHLSIFLKIFCRIWINSIHDFHLVFHV